MKVLIVDDHALFRVGLQLEGYRNIASIICAPVTERYFAAILHGRGKYVQASHHHHHYPLF